MIIKYNKHILLYMLSCLIFFGMIVIFEIIFGIIIVEYPFSNPDVCLEHPVLGLDLKNNYVENHCLTKIDFSKIKKIYTISNGIRFTAGNSNENQNFVALFGCSMAFGWGCNDDETFVSRLCEYLPNYNGYNFAVPSASTQHMYYKLKTNKVKSVVSEDTGVGIFMAFGFQPERLHLSVKSPWVNQFPDYIYDRETDDLIYNGSIGALHPKQELMYSFLRKSNILRYFKPYIPPYTNTLIKKYVDQIYVSKKYFLEQFPGSRFIVLIAPPDYTFPKIKLLKKLLEERKIEYMVPRKEEYFDVILSIDRNETMYPDAHFTPLTQDMLAKEFCQYLTKQKL